MAEKNTAPEILSPKLRSPKDASSSSVKVPASLPHNAAEVTAVFYLTQAGKEFYGRPEPPATGSFSLQLNYDDEWLCYPAGAGVGWFRRVEVGRDPRFLDGYLRFYTYFTNTDPGPDPPQGVQRFVVLGLRGRGELGFMKELELLGADYPDFASLDFHAFASCRRVPHEVVIEAGAVTALA